MPESKPPHKLEGSTIEFYIGLAVAIVTVVFPMTWWLRCLFLLALVAMGIDVAFRHPRIIERHFLIKTAISLSLVGLIVVLAWNPIREAYKEEKAKHDTEKDQSGEKSQKAIEHHTNQQVATATTPEPTLTPPASTSPTPRVPTVRPGFEHQRLHKLGSVNAPPRSDNKSKSAAQNHESTAVTQGTKTQNSSSPNISAPNGIAIGRDNYGNPTVNNYGPPPLIISKRQQDELKRVVFPFLDQFSGQKINISIHNANPEAIAFATGISKAFENAGFETNTGAVTFIGASLARGVTIRFGVNREKIAIAVRDALMRSGTVDKVYPARGVDENDFLIIVAP